MKEKVTQQIHNAVIDILAQERKRQGLSHEKLAQLAGIHRTAISHIENRRRNPSLIICLKLATALELSFSEIIAQAESTLKKR